MDGGPNKRKQKQNQSKAKIKEFAPPPKLSEPKRSYNTTARTTPRNGDNPKSTRNQKTN